MTPRSKTAQLLGKIEQGTELEVYEAAKVLADMKGAKIFIGLTRILRTHERDYSRQAAAYALSFCQDRKAVKCLLDCAANPREEDSVRGQALEGMANHLQFASANSGLRKKAEKLMLRMLTFDSVTLRFWACFGLGSLGCKRAIPRLRKTAVTDTEIYPGWWSIREEAEDALDRISGGPGKDRVPAHLRDRGERERSSGRKPSSKRSPSSRKAPTNGHEP